jgi:hypothetical protein
VATVTDILVVDTDEMLIELTTSSGRVTTRSLPAGGSIGIAYHQELVDLCGPMYAVEVLGFNPPRNGAYAEVFIRPERGDERWSHAVPARLLAEAWVGDIPERRRTYGPDCDDMCFVACPHGPRG